jgi:hypothetical protein
MKIYTHLHNSVHTIQTHAEEDTLLVVYI